MCRKIIRSNGSKRSSITSYRCAENVDNVGCFHSENGSLPEFTEDAEKISMIYSVGSVHSVRNDFYFCPQVNATNTCGKEFKRYFW